MTESLETVRKIWAWSEGKPTARGEAINVHIGEDDDVLIVAFLRMGGESRPWGVAFGKSSEEPTILTVAEGRNRTRVADMMIEFAPFLLEHFRHPQHSEDSLLNWEANSYRQIFLPGPTHIEMLHYIALSYARTKWERDDIEILKAIGNLTNCLYIEQQRPGQQTVITASQAIQSAFVFPASSVRQAHLGYLLGWLQGGKTRDERLASARKASEKAVATVLDPEFERKSIQPLVEKWGEAVQAGDARAQDSAETAVNAALTPELLRRWELARDSMLILRNDSRGVNPGLQDLVLVSKKAFNRLWGERAIAEDDGGDPFWPNPFTDYNTRMAAGGYHQRVADEQKARHYLVHGDRELQREELAIGHGIIGTVMSVATDEPEWVIKYSYPDLTTIRAGKRLVIAGAPEMILVVSDIDHDTQTIVAAPKWKNAKRKYESKGLPSRDQKWKGQNLVFIDSQPFGLSERLAGIARRRSDDPNDISNRMKVRQRQHAANNDEGPVNPESDD
jgi:hypothetical protein